MAYRGILASVSSGNRGPVAHTAEELAREQALGRCPCDYAPLRKLLGTLWKPEYFAPII